MPRPVRYKHRQQSRLDSATFGRANQRGEATRYYSKTTVSNQVISIFARQAGSGRNIFSGGMPKIFDRLGQPPVGRITVHSALNPILWLSVLTPICLSAAYAFRTIQPAMYILLALGSLPVVFGCIAFAYFAVTKPEKLQSEDFQIRHEAMQLIKQKGTPIEIDASTLDAITNPLAKELTAKSEDKE